MHRHRLTAYLCGQVNCGGAFSSMAGLRMVTAKDTAKRPGNAALDRRVQACLVTGQLARELILQRWNSIFRFPLGDFLFTFVPERLLFHRGARFLNRR